MRIAFQLNGRDVAIDCDPATMTLAVLRELLGITSVRGTCGIGLCGTCTAVIDGKTTSTCILPAGQLDGARVETVEAMDGADPVLVSFERAGAYQCGFCIPAMAVTVRALLEESSAPTDAEIDIALAGNICRCGCYLKIRDAVHLAAAERRSAS